jgi:hypothetical protein
VLSEVRSLVLSTSTAWAILMALTAIGAQWVASLPAPVAGDTPEEKPRGPEPPPAGDTTLERFPDGRAAERGVAAAEALATGGRWVVNDPLGGNLRIAPSATSAVIATLPPGTPVDEHPTVLEAESAAGGWRRVVWKGQAGWVRADLLRPVDPNRGPLRPDGRGAAR